MREQQETPLVSIIVPVYNVEGYLEKCLNSVLEQTLKNIEIIIVNDGSTDRSGEICNQYAKKDSRIKVFHKEYGGVSSARNAGIHKAQGEFIGFVDSDDWVYPDMFEVLYKNARGSAADIVICNLLREINGEVIYVENKHPNREMTNLEAMRELFKGHLYRFALWNKLYRRSCFSNIEFPEGRIHEDLSTTYKLFSKAEKIVYLNYTGYIYVKRENSILNQTYNEKRLDAFLGWEEILMYMKKNYPTIFKEVVACFGYWSTDNVFYILNQMKNRTSKKEYLTRIQLFVRKNYLDLMGNKILPWKYKLLLSFYCLDIKWLLLLRNKETS
ncbi:glycosyltransferase [Pullulanibacillus sp. KACC 23026]|uniref:glycosyltransferase family 2 protein n=1 Tax=Pullulanibacillus sp. KACC 23026 TaxID=3028315 RepID=UPI0023AEEC9E|nr:glycosyltransferase [Pullulanibacillus sp. KACC 23026]WEG11507.1 glycosyltransferase [Pullulanibacillus sp. KACC 23026]